VLAPLGTFLTAASLPSPGGVPAFVVFVAALLVAVVSMALWLELLVRSAAIAAATLFLPLALAGLVWPSVSHWCRRLADTIAALVLSKLVVAAVLSLAAGALAGAGGGSAGDASAGFATAMTGIALLMVATTSPFVLLRLVPAVEAGAVFHLEHVRHRLQRSATAPVRATAAATQLAGAAGMLVGGAMAGSAGTGASVGMLGRMAAADREPVSGGSGSEGGVGMVRGDPRGWGPFSAHVAEVLASTVPGQHGRTPPAQSRGDPPAQGAEPPR
jgi:hypothetical protein